MPKATESLKIALLDCNIEIFELKIVLCTMSRGNVVAVLAGTI